MWKWEAFRIKRLNKLVGGEKSKRPMLTLNLLFIVNSKTERLAVWNEEIVDGKRALCIEDVFDMVL